MENEPLFLDLVVDLESVYLCLFLQVLLVQLEEGTHKSEEPAETSR